MPPWATSIVWIDANGQKTITKVNTFAGFGSFSGALKNLSNADFLLTWESITNPNPTPAPVASIYQSTQDRAALIFKCVDNTLVTVIVPAPSLNIFLADGETVDATSLAVATFVVNVVGSLTNAAGSLMSSYVAGYRLPRSINPA